MLWQDQFRSTFEVGITVQIVQFLNIIGNGKESGGLGVFTVLFLLTLYLIGTVELSSFHAVIHKAGNDSELHSLVNELNACHQSVYHNKKDESCEHKSHVVALKKCPLCHLSLQSFHLFNTKTDLESIIVSASIKGAVYDSTFVDVVTLIPSRAPPVA